MPAVEATMPVATVVVRLSDVAPDGSSALVATGVLNLTHRLSDTDPSPMPTRGLATEEVRIPLRTGGYRFSALVQAVVRSDQFRMRRVPQPQATQTARN